MEKKKNLKNRVFAGLLALTLAGCKPALVKAEKSDVEYVTPTVIEYTGHENDYEYFEEEFMMYGCKETGLHAHVYEDENGNKTEPIEYVYIDCPEEYSGTVMDKLGRRKGVMLDMQYVSGNRVKIQFEVPARGLIGYRDEFLTDTRGLGIINTLVKGYEPYKGDFPDRQSGSLVCDRSGTAVAYGIWELEDRGRFFIVPGDPVYEGEVVGERNKELDLLLNPTRTKKLTNLRASGKDEAVSLTPVVKPSLEQAIQFIKDDELVEVTPKSIRMRKKILDSQQRKIFNNRGEIPQYLL